MDNVQVRTRCSGCGRGLGFEEWSRGLDRCPYCVSVPNRKTAAPDSQPMQAAAGDDYDRLLDDVPEDLLDELVSLLEAEVERRPSLAQRAPGPRPAMAAPAGGYASYAGTPEIVIPSPPPSPVREVMDDIGIGRSPRELAWAAWGFAGGFTANVALAKYAQVTTGAPMTQFFAPMVIGGLLTGAACAAIGWGLAKVLDRS